MSLSLGFTIKNVHFSDNISRVADLNMILDEVAQNVSECQLSDEQTTKLSSMIKGTRNVLEEIAVCLEQYKSLGRESLTLSSKLGKAWKKVLWDQDTIRDYRSRITSHTSMLSVLNSDLTSKASRRVIESLDERVRNLQLEEDRTERQALLRWLTPLNFPAQQIVFFSKRQEGTGRWLLDSTEFKTWMSTPGKTLLCRGMPGAGKTILASTVIDHLLKMLYGSEMSVLYIYCDYRKEHEQTLDNLIASMLKQLLQRQIPIPENVRQSYHHYVTSDTRPDSKEMYTLLHSTLDQFSHIYIVVDAIDELNSSGEVRHAFLSDLKALQEAHTINLMVTSRHIPEIIQKLGEPLCLEIRASDEDVRKYVQGHINGLAKCVLNNILLQELIVNSIVNAVDGMFLLAQLHMESLTDKTNPKAIKKSLQELPKGSSALKIAYEQAMQRIEDQKPGFSDLAYRTLSWITYACRLLTVTELCHALAIEVGTLELDEENLDDIEVIISVCCGLVTVDPETTAVRLVHFTTQDYFKSAGHHHFPNAKEDIAASCLTYLLFDEFGKGSNKDHEAMPLKKTDKYACHLEKYPFLGYATCFWARHAEEECTTDLEDKVGRLLIEFLSDDYKVSNTGWVVFRENRERGLRRFSSPTPISGMHLAAYFNLSDAMSRLLETGLLAADLEDHVGRTPLHFAAYKGNEAAVKILLARRDVDINKSTPWDFDLQRTALTLAAENGHTGVVKLLLEREDIDVNRKADSKTPLMWAIIEGHSAVLNLLIMHEDILASDQDSLGQTAIFWAAWRGQANTVQLLLGRDDVDADRSQRSGVTPLAVAASYGNIEVVKLLLKREDVDVNSKDNRGKTVLEYATRTATEELIRSAIQARSGTSEGQPSPQE